MPVSRRRRFATICGSNMPATSRGAFTSTGPTTFSLDPELSAVLAAMAGDTAPEPLAPGDWKT
ncbi:hypothetical protein [Streptomyces atroolivaceus]|uniref:hypothetical protein n=1 Tax=Streptomyces atroolivaceus TaxID=66869 RepID=UPI0037A551E8